MRSDQPLGVPVKVRTDTRNKLKGVKKGIYIYIYNEIGDGEKFMKHTKV